jgi:hypothetical protein
MDKVEVTKTMTLKKPIFKKDRDKPLTVRIQTRKPKKRKTGKLDYSDYSELLQDIDREKPVDDKTILTKDVADDLKEKILRGLTDEQACELVGVGYRTFALWLQKYPLFKEFIRRCKAQVEFDALEYIQDAMGGGTWAAAAWFLERKYPQRYGKRDVLKQQIYSVHMEFVRVVLDIVNEEDPEIKTRILNKLKAKKIDLGSV